MQNDIPSSIREKYKKIVGVSSVDEETSQRIDKINATLNIKDDDALWEIFMIMEMYIRTLGDLNARIKTTFNETLQEYRDKGGVINLIEKDPDKKFSIANLFCVFGIVFLIGAICFLVGVSINEFSPEWITYARTESPLAFVMQMPAGLIFFMIAALPSGIIIGRSASKIKSAGSKDEKLKHIPVLLIASMIVFIGIFGAVQILV